MDVVTMQRPAKASAPVSGSAMDSVVATRRLPRWAKPAAAALLVLAAAIAFYFLAPSGNSQTLAAERTTVSPVTRGTFDDFIPLRARVTPLVTVFLDAIEGGRVEQVLVEDGATVQKGQLLAVLSNAELQLSVLARESEVTEQLNAMRSQELALSQTRLANERAVLEAEIASRRMERQFRAEEKLANRGFVAKRAFADTRDNYAYEQRRVQLLRRNQATDEQLQANQLRQLRASAESLESSLALARANLEALNLRAPVAGQLSGFTIQVGQSMQRGERLGQIDSPGRNKLEAGIDEFYLGRVQPGQRAELDWGGRKYAARVTRISPQVQNGQFLAELQFVGDEPADIQRGQTLQARLTLGDPTPAVLVPNGAFYNDTGGSWVFVVAPDGESAVKRAVRLGRRNTRFIEVLDGLQPGERVITSPYTGFADKDRLNLTP